MNVSGDHSSVSIDTLNEHGGVQHNHHHNHVHNDTHVYIHQDKRRDENIGNHNQLIVGIALGAAGATAIQNMIKGRDEYIAGIIVTAFLAGMVFMGILMKPKGN